MRIRFGTYDWYPCVWTDLEGWMYVTRWNKISDPIVLTNNARILTCEEFLEDYRDLGMPPFSAEANSIY